MFKGIWRFNPGVLRVNPGVLLGSDIFAEPPTPLCLDVDALSCLLHRQTAPTMPHSKQAYKMQIQKTHTSCRRCGRTSFHLQKKVCSACGYPSARNRHYNWGAKMIRRKNRGTGRMRYEKELPRRFKNGFREKVSRRRRQSAGAPAPEPAKPPSAARAARAARASCDISGGARTATAHLSCLMRGRSRCPLRAANAARVARVLSRRRSLAMLCAAGASFLTSLTDLCPSLLVLADRGSAEEEGGGCIDNFWRHTMAVLPRTS